MVETRELIIIAVLFFLTSVVAISSSIAFSFANLIGDGTYEAIGYALAVLTGLLIYAIVRKIVMVVRKYSKKTSDGP